ncbi:MAG: hypothetical protein HGB10_03080 [Coriobacteriia bacterium]|nr:hypothetical protein [Coriobacteriia bacterium]
MRPWIKFTLIGIAVLAIGAALWFAASALLGPRTTPPGKGKTIADAVFLAVEPKVDEVTTATIGPANKGAAGGYVEARIISATAKKPEWKIVPADPGTKRAGSNRVETQVYGSNEAHQRWLVFSFSDGSALRIEEYGAAEGGLLNAWRVKSIEVTRP